MRYVFWEKTVDTRYGRQQIVGDRHGNQAWVKVGTVDEVAGIWQEYNGRSKFKPPSAQYPLRQKPSSSPPGPDTDASTPLGRPASPVVSPELLDVLKNIAVELQLIRLHLVGAQGDETAD